MEKVSIIVTSYNNSHNLENCIKSLTGQDYDPGLIDLEIIFIDSGSTDNSVGILNKYKDEVKILIKPKEFSRLSPAMARNIGVNNAKGNILIFTDSDCIFPKNLVRDTVNCFKDGKINCVIGNREPDFGQGFGTFIRRYDFILYSNKFVISDKLLINKETLEKGAPLILVSGNNFAIKKEVWTNLGGMKEIFKNPAGEDIMLEADIIKNGYNILFFPDDKIMHIHPISMKELFKKNFQRSEATYLLGKKSNGFVGWKNFAERGHNLNIRNFLVGASLIVLLTAFLFKISFYLAIVFLFSLYVFSSLARLVIIKNKLDSILNSKEERYGKEYGLPSYKIFFFDQTHFFMNILASVYFLWCAVKDKYGIFAKKIKRQG